MKQSFAFRIHRDTVASLLTAACIRMRLPALSWQVMTLSEFFEAWRCVQRN